MVFGAKGHPQDGPGPLGMVKTHSRRFLVKLMVGVGAWCVGSLPSSWVKTLNRNSEHQSRVAHLGVLALRRCSITSGKINTKLNPLVRRFPYVSLCILNTSPICCQLAAASRVRPYMVSGLRPQASTANKRTPGGCVVCSLS